MPLPFELARRDVMDGNVSTYDMEDAPWDAHSRNWPNMGDMASYTASGIDALSSRSLVGGPNWSGTTSLTETTADSGQGQEEV